MDGHSKPRQVSLSSSKTGLSSMFQRNSRHWNPVNCRRRNGGNVGALLGLADVPFASSESVATSLALAMVPPPKSVRAVPTGAPYPPQRVFLRESQHASDATKREPNPAILVRSVQHLPASASRERARPRRFRYAWQHVNDCFHQGRFRPYHPQHATPTLSCS